MVKMIRNIYSLSKNNISDRFEDFTLVIKERTSIVNILSYNLELKNIYKYSDFFHILQCK